MTRPLRIEFPGALYHITSRGNARQAIFGDDEDRSLFLRLLSRTFRECGWKCYSYCLMGNHYHLLLETPKANLSRGMHILNSVYAQKYNRRHERVGHLLQDRFHSVLVDKEEYLLEVCRYVVLNPVRAGIVADPADYRWSSYIDILGKRKAPDFLERDFVLSLFSQPGRNGVDEYRSFVLAGLGVNLWSNLRNNIILGSDAFAAQIQEHIGDKAGIGGIRREEQLADRPALSTIFWYPNLSMQARNQKIFEACLKYGYSYREIAKYVHLDPSQISRIVSSVRGKSATHGA